MKTKKIIILGFVSLFTLAAVVGWQMYNKGPKDIKHSKAIPVNAADLYNAFEHDTTTALKMYDDKVLLVSGTIERTQNNNQQQQIVFLKTNEDGAYVNCTMEEKGNFVAGNKIVIKGICGGIGQGDEDLGLKGDVYLTRCYTEQE